MNPGIEVVVVGGGIAGASAALRLADREIFVTVVDRERSGAGATGAAAGMLTSQYEIFDRLALRALAVESRRRWPEFARRLEERTGCKLPVRTPGLLVALFGDRERRDAERRARQQRRAGLRAEVRGRSEAEQLSSVLPDADAFLWLSDERAVDAQRLGRLLPLALKRSELRVLEGEAVEAVRLEQRRVRGVRLASGPCLDADVVILAAGARSACLEGLPRRLPVEPVRGEILSYQDEGLGDGPILADASGSYVVPTHDGVLVGSTMDRVGFDRSVTDDAARLLRERGARLFPSLAGREPRSQWAGLRPVTPDGLPVLGREPLLEGLVYATGAGRHGILLGPFLGKMAADLAVGDGSEPDHRSFRVERFEEVKA